MQRAYVYGENRARTAGVAKNRVSPDKLRPIFRISRRGSGWRKAQHLWGQLLSVIP